MRTLIPLLAGLLLAAATAPAGAVSGCAALGGTGIGGVCQVRQTTPNYVVNLSYPLGYPDEQAIVDYLAETRDDFVEVAATPSPLGLPMELDVTWESLGSTRTRSVILTLFQNVGGAHPTTWYRSFTFDLVQGRPITFDTLFASGSQPLEAIFPLVRSELEARTGMTGMVDSADGLDARHYQNFAITDNAVTFYFGRGEMLPAVAGAMSVTLPRNALPPLAV
jgi:hypothetical protein